MRLAELRRTLNRIALTGLPALSLAACDPILGLSADADVPITRTITIQQPADPTLQQLINACATGFDQASCDSMCRRVICNFDTGNPQHFLECTLSRSGAVATVTVSFDGSDGCPSTGRRPAGLAAAGAVSATSAAGAWLARAAQLEAASVHAFVSLARELQHHGAPARLWRGALVAASDEVEHAALTAELARRSGGPLLPVEVATPGIRSLAAVALENAVEGCVRETWGALLALYQARAAHDPEIRVVMARIAADELRHAALGWAVDRFCAPRLDEAARAQVELARAGAVAGLAAELDGATFAPELLEPLGLPDETCARRLLDEARAALWS